MSGFLFCFSAGLHCLIFVTKGRQLIGDGAYLQFTFNHDISDVPKQQLLNVVKPTLIDLKKLPTKKFVLKTNQYRNVIGMIKAIQPL